VVHLSLYILVSVLVLHLRVPLPLELAVSADRDGGIAMWLMGETKPEAELAAAHDRDVHDLAWNPLGTVLATGEAANHWVHICIYWEGGTALHLKPSHGVLPMPRTGYIKTGLVVFLTQMAVLRLAVFQ
jgi:hypothetical protein